MEIIDIYDKDHKRTGRTMARGDKAADGDYYLVTHLCIFGSDGRMLIQRRQLTKKAMPGVWDVSAGGFVKSGEDSRSGIRRETFEELGLALKEGQAHFLKTAQFMCVLDDFYIMKQDLDPAGLKLLESELMAVGWESEENILAMIDRGQFVDYDKDLIRECFAAGRKL